jgi:hypothetical protein
MYIREEHQQWPMCTGQKPQMFKCHKSSSDKMQRASMQQQHADVGHSN